MNISDFEEKKAKHKKRAIVGLVIFLMGAITVFPSATQTTSVGGGSLLFIIIGILLMISFILDIRLELLYKKYSAVIEFENIRDINEISKKVNLPIEKVKTDLKKLREKKLLEYSVETKEVIQKQVKCNGCGADNTITVGVLSKCEFCGSPLDVD